MQPSQKTGDGTLQKVAEPPPKTSPWLCQCRDTVCPQWIQETQGFKGRVRGKIYAGMDSESGDGIDRLIDWSIDRYIIRQTRHLVGVVAESSPHWSEVVSLNHLSVCCLLLQETSHQKPFSLLNFTSHVGAQLPPGPCWFRCTLPVAHYDLLQYVMMSLPFLSGILGLGSCWFRCTLPEL